MLIKKSKLNRKVLYFAIFAMVNEISVIKKLPNKRVFAHPIVECKRIVRYYCSAIVVARRALKLFIISGSGCA